MWEIELHYKQLPWTVQKQPSTVIHFWKFLKKITVVESFCWSNYRLAVQSSNFILKWHAFRLDCPEAAVRSHPFSKISPENTGGCCLIYLKSVKYTIAQIESFFRSNYRLALQSSDYILKWLHQECFLGNLPKDFGAPKYYRL